MEIAKLKDLGLPPLEHHIDAGYEPKTSWVSGSIVEGLGHANSDIDVFALCPRLDATTAPTKDYGGYHIHVIYEEGRRIDIEYWSESAVAVMRGKLEHFDQDREDVNWLDYLREEQVDFLHRLDTGIPLTHPEEFAEFKNSLRLDHFKRFLIEQKRIYLDDAFDDTAGLYETGQMLAGVFRARAALELSMDYLLYAIGVTNPRDKQRYRLFSENSAKHALLGRHADALWNMIASVPLDGESKQQRYIATALRLTETIYLDVDRYMRGAGETAFRSSLQEAKAWGMENGSA